MYAMMQVKRKSENLAQILGYQTGAVTDDDLRMTKKSGEDVEVGRLLKKLTGKPVRS